MLSDRVRVDSFTDFVAEAEPRIRRALTAAFGTHAGSDASAEAFVYAWRHWDRVSAMENPAGYLYRVGYNTARKPKKADLVGDYAAVAHRVPWVEPGLGPALAGLPEQQRTVIVLVHAFEWSFNEVAELLGVAKSTVQSHEQRAMTKLQHRLGVSL